MKQEQIDELLQSSDDEDYGIKKKLKQKQQKQKAKEEQNYDDDFFESQTNSEANKKKPAIKPEVKNKKNVPLNKMQEKLKPKLQKEPSQMDEQQYMNSEDFESVDEQGDQKFNKVVKQQQPKRAEPQKQDNYELDQDFQQELAESLKAKSQAASEDLVKSEYEQSRAKQEQDIEEVADNFDEEIETIQSSKVRSHVLNDDDIPQDQSQYIESTRINQQQFKKRTEGDASKDEANILKKNNEKKLKETGSSKQIDMKKKKAQPPQSVSNKQQALKKDTIPSKKSIPQARKQSEKPSQKGTEKNTIQIKSQKNIEPKSKVTKLSKNSQTLNPSKNASQIKAGIQQRMTKIAEIEAEKKVLYQKRTAKQREQQQKAKQEYEQMKKKEEQRKEQNRRILEQRKKKQKEDELGGTLPRQNKRTAQQKQQLQLTDSKIKQLTDQQQKIKRAKNQMKIAQEIKQKRKQQEEQVRSKLQKENKQKLKKLQQQKQGYMDKTYQQKNQYKEKREEAMKEKKKQYMMKQNEKINEKKQQETPEVRKIKQEIASLKQKLNEKQSSISDLDDIIKQLKQQLNKKQLIRFNQGEDEELKLLKDKGISGQQLNLLGLGQSYLDSQLTCIQQFVRLFDQCETPGQIFQMIDQNGDQFVSLGEVKTKVTQILLHKHQQNDLSQSQQLSPEQLHMRQSSLKENDRLQSLVQQVFTILDKNSDGNITQDEFSFIIETEIKKAKEFRRLTNNLAFTNPIDIEASILDMKEKIKFMQKKSLQELSDGKLYQLEEKYQKYLQKHKQYESRYIYGTSKEEKDKDKDKIKRKNQKQQTALQQNMKNDRHYFLTQEVTKLRIKKQNQQKMLEKIRKKQEQNIKEKNLELTQKVQQNIKLNQEIYRLKLQIEEYQLRFLSKTKIQENRYRYMAKKSEQNQLYEQAIQRAKQYQTKILNPTKQIKFGTYTNQVKYLAAVIMIQRNFRKRKAIREKERLERGQ